MLKHVENCSNHVDGLLSVGLGLTNRVFQRPAERTINYQIIFLIFIKQAGLPRMECFQPVSTSLERDSCATRDNGAAADSNRNFARVEAEIDRSRIYL